MICWIEMKNSGGHLSSKLAIHLVTNQAMFPSAKSSAAKGGIYDFP